MNRALLQVFTALCWLGVPAVALAQMPEPTVVTEGPVNGQAVWVMNGTPGWVLIGILVVVVAFMGAVVSQLSTIKGQLEKLAQK